MICSTKRSRTLFWKTILKTSMSRSTTTRNQIVDDLLDGKRNGWHFHQLFNQLRRLERGALQVPILKRNLRYFDDLLGNILHALLWSINFQGGLSDLRHRDIHQTLRSTILHALLWVINLHGSLHDLRHRDHNISRSRHVVPVQTFDETHIHESFLDPL